MLIVKYFTCTGAALVVLLLAVSAYLEPGKAASPEEFLGLRPAQASVEAKLTAEPDTSLVDRLRMLPIQK